MRKLNTFFLFVIVFLALTNKTVVAQQKCYCKVVKGYTKDAGKVYPGETLKKVKPGEELWVHMDPSAAWNTEEDGGCRLKPGEKYVVDENNIVIRVDGCGNNVLEYIFYTTTPTTTTTTTTPPPIEEEPGGATGAFQDEVVNRPIIWDNTSLDGNRQTTPTYKWKNAKPFFQRTGGKVFAWGLGAVGVGGLGAGIYFLADHLASRTTTQPTPPPTPAPAPAPNPPVGYNPGSGNSTSGNNGGGTGGTGGAGYGGGTGGKANPGNMGGLDKLGFSVKLTINF